ncbi:MAG: TPM domain-containing protein [Aquabacterium sp.]|uniref:TPM domain-containing protein n=1 Tax=Aquabacterium sp. TaxID=1872578 RepID=UPI003BE3A03B
MDQSAMLSTAQRQALENQLTALEQARGSQVVVLLVPTTQPEDIAAFANRVADAWKIGRKDIGDGLLIVVAKNDRRVRIEVARALEGAIPDLTAHRIIDDVMTPAFKQGDFAGGLTQGISQIDKLIAGEALPVPAPSAQPKPASSNGSDMSLDTILGFLAAAATIGFLIVTAAASLLSKLLGDTWGIIGTHLLFGGLAWALTGNWVAGVIAVVVVAALFLWGIFGGSFVGGGGSSSSGGGFSSGGGGSFGGGGSSGSW